MIVTAEEFRKHFSPGAAGQESLLRLLEFQNRIQDWYSGYFELASFGDAGLLTWFDDPAAAAQFVQLGHSAGSSLYCFCSEAF